VNTAAFVSVFAASVAGSVHCAAMCGGFVAAYAGADERAASRAAAHAAYNAGRLATYLALGAAAGGLGRVLELAGSAVGLAHVAAVLTGALLVGSGLFSLIPRPRLVRLGRGPARGPAALLAALLGRFRRRPAVVRALVLGLSTTLLPCGWLYAFVAVAATTGSAASGAWLMSAFWLGSLPMLLGLGVSVQLLTRRFARYLPRVRSVVLLGAGLAALFTHLQLPAFAAAAERTDTAGHALPTPADCPCHRGKHAPAQPVFGTSSGARP
jgi:sulfite exporter TauE/SafE